MLLNTADEDAQDPYNIITTLHQPLSTVTQLSIHLMGSFPNFRKWETVAPASQAIRILGPLCCPLTHIAISGEVLTGTKATLTPFLDAAKDACASSLTHLQLDMQAKSHTMLASPGLQKKATYEFLPGKTPIFKLEDSACEALSSFASLVHLDIGHGLVVDDSVWVALPPSLQSLHVGSCSNGLATKLSLLNLRELALERCSCNELQTLLEACPLLQRLQLKRLFTPTTAVDLSILYDVVEHPVWRLAHSGGPHCFPVTEVHRDEERLATPHQDNLSSAELLASLPIMPNVTTFKYLFQEPLAALGEPILLHLPRAFPDLRVLHLQGELLVDTELAHLYACTSLHTLSIGGSVSVTGEAVLLLAAALPRLVSLSVARCKNVSEAQKKAATALIRNRVKAQGRA